MTLQLWCQRHKLQCHKQQILRQKVPRDKKKVPKTIVFNLSTNVWLLSMSTSHPPTTSAATRTRLCPSFKPLYFINLSMHNQMVRYSANSSSETLLFVLDYNLHPTVSGVQHYSMIEWTILMRLYNIVQLYVTHIQVMQFSTYTKKLYHLRYMEQT